MKTEFVDLIRTLTQSGCRAAGHRLSGSEPWPRFCCKPLSYSYCAILAALEALVPSHRGKNLVEILLGVLDEIVIAESLVLAASHDEHVPVVQ